MSILLVIIYAWLSCTFYKRRVANPLFIRVCNFIILSVVLKVYTVILVRAKRALKADSRQWRIKEVTKYIRTAKDKVSSLFHCVTLCRFNSYLS